MKAKSIIIQRGYANGGGSLGGRIPVKASPSILWRAMTMVPMGRVSLTGRTWQCKMGR
jgi:hypothetical protein